MLENPKLTTEMDLLNAPGAAAQLGTNNNKTARSGALVHHNTGGNIILARTMLTWIFSFYKLVNL
jgi:hypothetical protein